MDQFGIEKTDFDYVVDFLCILREEGTLQMDEHPCISAKPNFEWNTQNE